MSAPNKFEGTTNEFEEPTDEPIFDPPDGWYYGRVEAVGGGNLARVFRSERHIDALEPEDSYYEVQYTPPFIAITVYKITITEGTPDVEFVEEIDVEYPRDHFCNRLAIVVMRNHQQPSG